MLFLRQSIFIRENGAGLWKWKASDRQTAPPLECGGSGLGAAVISLRSADSFPRLFELIQRLSSDSFLVC